MNTKFEYAMVKDVRLFKGRNAADFIIFLGMVINVVVIGFILYFFVF